ncbi:hypothetical protein K504DRAFT_373872 [Pleomassaria siparia CBS 279.74]|uniref:Zn(2)-C6 fungal-type domain-containing protein n=1 Tax=Pleomassaria siparia CBS 279.74 TaxID=1314801 RepID=A0A6G1KEX0_9PLEO|nr:hypothetical protein K504DRAFT_373872 [Pleomassaria siparia CBS 279.74]
MTSPGSATPAQHARPAPLACLECRRQHLKCPGGKPACARCVSRGFECAYTPSQRGRRRHAYVKRCTHPASTLDHAQPVSPTLLNNTSTTCTQPSERHGLVSAIDDEQLVTLYYLNFHASHPMLLPRSLYWKRAYPRYLKAVVEFVGSHFSPTTSSDTLREATARELQLGERTTPEMVQACVLFTIALFARNEVNEAQRVLAQAIETAIELGMHRRPFAASHANNQPTEEESMRRTWYELYVTDGCIAAFQRKHSFTTNTVSANVLLPCDDSLYEDGICLLNPASRDDFESSVFADEEMTFSSFCYRIEAVRLLGRVLTITGAQGVYRDQVQAVDNALAAFLHHLPASKSEPEIINTYGELDELMFQTHVVIQYATTLLHYPRSDLPCPVVPFTMDVPGGNNAKVLCPCARQSVHSIKAIDASKTLSMLAAFRSPVQRHTPFFIYPLALGAIVQFSVSTMHSRSSSSCLEQHRDRIKLILGVLKSLGRHWSVAEAILRTLKRVALTVFRPSRSEDEVFVQQDVSADTAIDPYSNETIGGSWLDSFEFQDLQGLIGLDPDALRL